MTRAMMKWLFCLALLSSTTAHADCVVETEATPEATCVVMARAGQRGIWFRLAEADTLRRLRLEVPELRLQITSLEQIAVIQAERVTLYREANQERRSALEQSTTQLDASLGREHQLRGELNVWYRAPALWFAVGVVITAAAIVALGAAVGI